MKKLVLVLVMVLVCNIAYPFHKYEGLLCRSKCGIVVFHIFLDCGLKEMKPKCSPHDNSGIRCDNIIHWTNADGSKDSLKIDNSDGYFSLPSTAEPREVRISCEGYAPRTVRIDLSKDDFFYSCTLLKDFESLKKECDMGYSLFWMNMLAQAYHDGYLVEKNVAKADSIKMFAERLYSPDFFNRIGVVLDGDTGLPIENAHISYLNVYDKWKESTIISDKNGVFNLGLQETYYGIKINATGYQKRTVLFGERRYNHKLPMPYITTLIKNKNNMKKMIKADERSDFWKWQLGQCFLDGYSVKKNHKEAKELFWGINWTAGTTYYLDGQRGKYAIDNDWSLYDNLYIDRASEEMSFDGIRCKEIECGDVSRNDCYFWAGILGDYETFANWQAPDSTIAMSHAKLIADKGNIRQRLKYSMKLYQDGSPYAFDCLSNAINVALKYKVDYLSQVSECMNTLAKCYRFGRCGSIMDETKADYWTKQAALYNDQNAKKIKEYEDGVIKE